MFVVGLQPTKKVNLIKRAKALLRTFLRGLKPNYEPMKEG